MGMRKSNIALDTIEKWLLRSLLLLVIAYASGVLIHAGMEYMDVMSNQAQTAEKCKVAITFDDGPNPEYTVELLEGLQKRGVKAT